MRKITARALRRKGACEAGVNTFKQLFPDGVVPTRALCLAHAQDLDWYWGKHLLPKAARPAYDVAKADAQATYDATMAEAWDTYDAAMAEATGDGAWRAARAAHDATWVAGQAAENDAMAKAWADAAGLTDDGEG